MNDDNFDKAFNKSFDTFDKTFTTVRRLIVVVWIALGAVVLVGGSFALYVLWHFLQKVW